MSSAREYLFLDIEASGLGPNSYPIEVAWTNEIEGEDPHCFLINPYFVEEWVDWDPAAQAVHGISREQLRVSGIAPNIVAKNMNDLLAGGAVFCDGGGFDVFWINRLLEAADVEQRFAIRESRALFHQLLEAERSFIEVALDVPSAASVKGRIIEELSVRAREQVGGQRHRATVDVQYLEHLYHLVRNWKDVRAV